LKKHQNIVRWNKEKSFKKREKHQVTQSKPHKPKLISQAHNLLSSIPRAQPIRQALDQLNIEEDEIKIII
jgi:hypothetical protein